MFQAAPPFQHRIVLSMERVLPDMLFIGAMVPYSILSLAACKTIVSGIHTFASVICDVVEHSMSRVGPATGPELWDDHTVFRNAYHCLSLILNSKGNPKAIPLAMKPKSWSSSFYPP
jgi:hypothetical protein